MLDRLGRRDQRRIQHLLVIDIARDFACFLQDAVDGGTIVTIGVQIWL